MSKLIGNKEFDGDVYVKGVGGYDGTNAGTSGIKKVAEVINNNPWKKGSDTTHPGAFMGTGNARGEYSVASGCEVYTSALGAHAEGYGNENGINAEGIGSHAEGYELDSTGEGIVAGGLGSHAEGCCNEGQSIYAGGHGSHAEGCAESDGTILTDEKGAHAEGYSAYSGFSIRAQGAGSHAEGYNIGGGIWAKGLGSHAEGYNDDQDNETANVANGNGSHVEGHCTMAENDGEHAEGHFNLSNKRTTGTDAQKKAGSTLHSVGIGTANDNRKNAFEIMQNGDAYLYGLGGYNGVNPTSNKRLQDVVKFSSFCHVINTLDDSLGCEVWYLSEYGPYDGTVITFGNNNYINEILYGGFNYIVLENIDLGYGYRNSDNDTLLKKILHDKNLNTALLQFCTVEFGYDRNYLPCSLLLGYTQYDYSGNLTSKTYGVMLQGQNQAGNDEYCAVFWDEL